MHVGAFGRCASRSPSPACANTREERGARARLAPPPLDARTWSHPAAAGTVAFGHPAGPGGVQVGEADAAADFGDEDGDLHHPQPPPGEGQLHQSALGLRSRGAQGGDPSRSWVDSHA
eukprot:8198354-Pyramimonas_sp.AAC.1